MTVANRKDFRNILTATLVAVASVAASAPTHAEESIKIGVLLIDSGPLAGLKETQIKAANFAIDQANAAGGALGRKFEADFITYTGTPDSAVDGATRAVQKDGAFFITGMDTSAVAPALSAKMTTLNALMMEVMARADALTGKRCSANYFRVTETDSMVMGALNRFLKNEGIKKWDTLSVDYASGRDSAARFQSLIASQGGSIEKSLFAPSGTADFGAKISELGETPADGLYVTIFGSDAINLAKQQAQFGLFKKYKMVLGNSFVIPQTISAQGQSVVGVYQTLGFTPDFPGAEAQEFVKGYRQRYNGESPAFTSADQYAGIQLIVEAIKKANTLDVAAVRAALSGLKAPTVLGEVEVRGEDHQAVRPVSINKIVGDANGNVAFSLMELEPGPAITPPADPSCKM
jgi:branched-chain amino acid transport system substrate-binding protein